MQQKKKVEKKTNLLTLGLCFNSLLRKIRYIDSLAWLEMLNQIFLFMSS